MNTNVQNLSEYVFLLDEETQIMDTSSNIWRFKYLGESYLLNWSLLKHLPSTMFNLIQNYIVDRFIKFAPRTAHRSFDCFVSHSDSFKDLSFETCLKLSKQFYEQESDSAYYSSIFVNFYRWGLKKHIPLFHHDVFIVLDDLPKPNVKNSHEAIYLNQYYVEPEESAQFLEVISKLESHEETEEDLLRIIVKLLAFELAPRPSQIHLLNKSDFRETKVGEDKYLYELRLPIIKQQSSVLNYTSFRAVSERLGRCISKLLSSWLLLDDNTPLLGPKRICTSKLREFLYYGGSYLTFTHLRHNLAQSLADQGAPAEVISERMTHTSLSSARAYIAASPKIAEIKNKALGANNTFNEIIHTLNTGKIINKAQHTNLDSIVNGTVGGANNMKYLTGIGACNVSGSCPKNPVYSCYTCKKFNPFVDGPHVELLQTLRNEALEFMSTATDFDHNRPLTQLEMTIEAVQKVINVIGETHETVK